MIAQQAEPAAAAGSDAALDDEFLALVCSDAEWLRAEFDAVVAAAWRGRKPVWPTRPTPVPPVRRRTPVTVATGTTAGPSRPGVGGWARQRSPPGRRGLVTSARDEGR